MATIDLSSGFMAGLPNRILRFSETASTSNVAATSGLLMAGNDSYGLPGTRLTLMKGTVPVDLSTLTSYTSRSADTLVEFSVRSAHFAPTQPTINPAVISTIYVSAAATGMATWFWLTVRPTYYLDNPNFIIHQIIGTVGIIGSGSDLEMGSTSIVLGEPYRVLNLRIEFPSTWNYT